MKENNLQKIKLAIVIPAYQCKSTIDKTIEGVIDKAHLLIIVNDASTDKTLESVRKWESNKVIVVSHQKNLGVGGAMKTGIQEALRRGAQIIVKMDGDNQMDPAYLDCLIKPLLEDRADCAKGTRWVYGISRKEIPKPRLFGNTLLSLLTRFASGYWNVTDPNNGYLTWTAKILNKIDWNQIHNGYFFESSMLVQLNLLNARIIDVPMKPIYQGEKSTIILWKIIPDFGFNLIIQGIKRWWYKYFLYDMNAISIFLLFGFILVSFGSVFGGYQWWWHATRNIVTPTGTVMISILPLLIGIILLIQALVLDITESRQK